MEIKKIIAYIEQYETIIIHRHVRPDADAYGSQSGLAEIIKQSFPNKKVYIVGKEDPSLDYLAKMDTVADEQFNGALIIVCDTANTERIDDQRYLLGEKIIKIDHHPNNDVYGDLQWVDTNASSTSEMIYEFYLTAKESGFKFNSQAARFTFAGIVGDTGRFLYPSTNTKTFQYVADLVSYDFDRTKLYNEMYETKENIARLRGYILQNYQLTGNGVSEVRLTKEILKKYHVTALETGQLVSMLGDLEGIKAWVFFIEEDKIIRVRLRSKSIVINKIATKYNGGGHPLASGASVQTWEEADQVVKDLEEICR